MTLVSILRRLLVLTTLTALYIKENVVEDKNINTTAMYPVKTNESYSHSNTEVFTVGDKTFVRGYWTGMAIRDSRDITYKVDITMEGKNFVDLMKLKSDVRVSLRACG